jgi:formylglycine-generating enzyme required for sulfatase activity
MRTAIMWSVAVFFFSVNFAFPQDVDVKNVNAEQNFNDIIITYDLLSEGQPGNYTVTLYCSTNGGKVFGDPLRHVKGDVGFDISPGPDKKITWTVLDEVSQFVYDDVVFKVRATANTGSLMDLVLIEGGGFTMGNDMGEEDEKPAHEVHLSNFYISRYELTVKQYREYCEKTGRNMPEASIQWRDEHPMTHVSWEDAKMYCKWLSETTGETYRLPTEAEWEYVARGGISGTAYSVSGTTDLDSYAWHRGTAGGYAHYEVGQLRPNELGIYDIIGNVWEWCEDWYSKAYYAHSPGYNPTGPPSGRYKVARGGSWREPANKISETFRFFQSPTVKTNYVGFRVVKEP